MEATRTRKLDHLRITVDSNVEHEATTLLEDVSLIHAALPEQSLREVDSSIDFLGKRLNAPLMITGMTGGHPAAAEVNCALARVAAKAGIAMGVGSQRAALEDESLSWTYRRARECGGRNLVLVANIGAPQLVEGYSVEHARRALEMIDADALAVHVNAAQEAFQPEGDVDFRGAMQLIAEIARELDKPVIVKETGHGLSYEVVYRLRGLGVRFFDVSGAGGTSWVRVEEYRARLRGLEELAEAASTFSSWGIPTAQAIVEARWAAPDACIIGSGGIRSGLDAAKAVALGADIAGFALPAIRAYATGGLEAVRRLVERFILEFRATLFLTGSQNVAELRRKPLVVGGRLASVLAMRGISLNLYIGGARLTYKPGENCNP
jgi:isopentenyl-diphosphate delta-isomerase